MAKDSGKTQITTSMKKDFPKTGKPNVMSKGPRKLTKGEISNEVGRPPKR